MRFFVPFILAFHFGISASLALTTAYVQFEHPDGWKCELSQGVWICQSTQDADRKESVVLSIATQATEWDKIENYEEYLKQPRTIPDQEGKPLTSKVRYAHKRNINGQVWVDSLQFNSELPGFWSRYLATVHNKLAILITYIVSDEQYKKLAPQFERMASSLKLNAEFDLNIASKQGDGPVPGREKLGAVQSEILAKRLDLSKKRDEKSAQGDGGAGLDMNMVIGAGAAFVVLILLMRIRRKRAAAKKAKLAGPPSGGPRPNVPVPKEPTRKSG